MLRSLSRWISKASLQAVSKGIVTGLLCATLVAPGVYLAAQPRPARKATRKVAATPQLRGEAKTLHALNRLTFGARADDVAAVDAMGLEAWFQRQLHPEGIDDSSLDARLARFPAMQLSQTELVEKFPTPEMLRRYARGGLTVPDDDMERAIYADAALSYEEKREAKQADKAAQGASPAGQNMITAPDARSAAPIERVTTKGERVAVSVETSGDLGSPVLKDAVLDLPPAARMQRLLAMSPEQMAAFQAMLKGPDQDRLYAGMTPEQTEQAAAMKSPERVVGAEAVSVRLLRDVYSQRQLQAVMADFWLNHFSVFLHKNQNEPYLLPAYERGAVLPNALGRFEDLLDAVAKSPAMLVYLDNWESTGPNSKAAQRAATAPQGRPEVSAVKMAARRPQGINENYARELMELHTLGVNGGYSQQDVIEVAKCFTGWTLDRPAEGGEFLFNPSRHEPGDKTVLGHVIHESGMNEGMEVLHILATSPATAHFVSLKLAERFVSDAPPPVLVDRMAQSFIKTDGDIRAVLTTMFHSPEFWSPDVYRAKVKTPVEFVASALRATDAEVSNPVPLVQALDRLGMPVYGMQTPNGYSWQSEAWVSSNALLTRMNFALVLSGNRLRGTTVNWPNLLCELPGQTEQADLATEMDLESMLLGVPAGLQTREAALSVASTPGMQQQAEQAFRAAPVTSAMAGKGAMLRVKTDRRAAVASSPDTPVGTMAGLLLGSPDFQRR